MNKVYDLRSALKLLEEHKDQLLTSNVFTDPDSELAGVYHHIGAGGMLMHPTKNGPAMMFRF